MYRQCDRAEFLRWFSNNPAFRKALEALVKPPSAKAMFRGDFYKEFVRQRYADLRLRDRKQKWKNIKGIEDEAYDVDGGAVEVDRSKRKRAWGAGSLWKPPSDPSPLAAHEKLLLGSSYLELLMVR